MRETLLRFRLYGENLYRVEGSLASPSYPGQANFSYIFLQNLANRLHEKQKVGSARRVTCLAGSPFFDGRVTLLAGPTFLHINTLARLAGSTPSRRDNQSMCERCWLGKRGQLFSHINARWSWLGWEGDPLFRDNFSPYKQGLNLRRPKSKTCLAILLVNGKRGDFLLVEKWQDSLARMNSWNSDIWKTLKRFDG